MAFRGMGRASQSERRNRMHFLCRDMEYEEYSMCVVMCIASYEQDPV